MSTEETLLKLNKVLTKIESHKLSEAASNWWNAFVNANSDQPELVLRLATEIEDRSCKLQDLFSAYIWGYSEDIGEVLKFMDAVLDFKEKNNPSEDFEKVAKQLHDLSLV